jgi:hydrogenase/urease accessory protein HupE
MLARSLFALVLLCCAGLAQADVFRPAYLALRETGTDRYDVTWKVPVRGETRLGVKVVFPPGTVRETPPQGLFTDNAYVERWKVARPGGFAEQTLSIDGIASGVTDVIVRIEHADGTSQVEQLQPQRPQFTVTAATSTAAVAWSYLVLGVEHILGGVDHLLFVLALLLIVSGGKRILITITAFTLAHSITLVAATLGWVHISGPPVEAMIALSIVYVAAEIVRGLHGTPGLTARAPWIVAFSFGLLHGLGFAGALAEVGLPQKAIPTALFTFNVGVEIGQLIFVAVALAAGASLRRVPDRRLAWMPYVAPYAIGAIAMFWVIERIGAFSS